MTYLYYNYLELWYHQYLLITKTDNKLRVIGAVTVINEKYVEVRECGAKIYAP